MRCLWFLLAISPLMAAGCGGSSHASGQTTASSGSTQKKPSLPVYGTYTTSFTGNEHFGPPGHTLPTGTPNGGLWELTLGPGEAQFYNSFNGQTFPLGPSARITGQELVVAADKTCPHIYPRHLIAGIYTYRLLGRTLTFHKVSDTCLDRAATLTLHPWHRK